MRICAMLKNNADESGVWGKLVQITGVQWYGRGHGAWLCYICFCLSPSYHNLSVIQINPFRPSPNHSAIGIRSLQISGKIFNQSTYIGRPQTHLQYPCWYMRTDGWTDRM